MIAIFEGTVNPNHFVVWISFIYRKLKFFFLQLSKLTRRMFMKLCDNPNIKRLL